MIYPLTLYHWLILSTLLFSVGIYGLLTRRNAVGILMAVELILNSGALNFVIFNRFIAPSAVDGKIMALFIIAVAAAEVVVAMAIFVTLFKERKTMDVTQIDTLRDDPSSAEATPAFSEFVPFLAGSLGEQKFGADKFLPEERKT